MAQSETAVDLQLVPMLNHLARLGLRAVESAPGTLRPRHLIALKLLSEQAPIGQQSLAEALSLDPSNVVGLLNELEERELITRRRDPADRRRHIVEISTRGADELAQASSRLAEVEDRLFAALTPDERHTLHDLLTRAVGATSRQCCAADLMPECMED